MEPASLTRLQWLALSALALASLGLLSHLVYRDPEVPFLPPGWGEAQWIEYRFAAFAGAMRTLDPPHPFTYSRRFEIERVPERAVLSIQAIRRLQLRVNGQPVFPGERPAWREPVVVDIAPHLRPGTNEVVALVRYAIGPALLRVRPLEGGLPLATDDRWSATVAGRPTRPAEIADDTRQLRESLRLPTPADALGAVALPLLLLFAAGVGLSHAVQTRLREPFEQWALFIAPLLVSAGWIALLFGRLGRVPLLAGFDAHGHLDYVHFLLEQGRLPLATDGVSMYHPPLFYLAVAGVTGLVGAAPGSAAEVLAYRLVPMAAGLASVWAVWWAARRLFADEPLPTALATGLAGLLPMHVYMATFVSNESTATATAAASFAVAVAVLLADRVSPATWAALVGVTALGLLSKYSGVVVAGLALGGAALRPWLREGAPFWRTPTLLAALGLAAAALGGWPYLRSAWVLGTPFPWNRGAGGEGLWWHQPGFHTVDFFLRFGESLRHPMFAGFASYWDGVYATLWGDALAAGTTDPAGNPGGWNLDWMFATYPLALPVTALLLLGVGRAFARALSGEDVGRRLAWSLVVGALWTFALSHVAFAIRYPSYSSKAFYALPALLPLCLAGALGLVWPFERLAGPRFLWVRSILGGALLAFAGVLVLSFAG